MCNKWLLALFLSVFCCSAFEQPYREPQENNVIHYTREQLLALRGNQTPPLYIPEELQRFEPEEDPQR